METARGCIMALLLVVGVYFQEAGFTAPRMPSSIQSHVASLKEAIARRFGSSFAKKMPSLDGELQERRREFNAVVFDTVPTYVTTSSVSPAKALTGRFSAARMPLAANHSWVEAEGEVSVILSYDPAEDRYQKFMVRLNTGKLLLISHDTASAPRVENLKLGDRIACFGEYAMGQNGEEISWPQEDGDGQHESGWLKHNGKTYQ